MTSVKRVTDIIGEIAAASGEQSSGIDQVNRAVTQMDRVVQSNAAETEEVPSTAQSLRAQAQQLQALVGRFKLGDEEKRRDPPAASAEAKSPAPSGNGPGARPAYVNGSAKPHPEAFEEF